MAKRTWTEKLNAPVKREVKPAPKDFADIKAGQMMLLTTAKDVDAYVRRLPAGTDIGTTALRAGLARKYKADIACPVVTGIHFRTVAEVAGEQLDAGLPAADVAPVWRALPPKSPVWKKLENGADRFRQLRKAEGLPI